MVGLAIAFWANKALLRIYLPADSTDLNISTLPDFRILVFTLGVTVLTGIVFGLVPALQTTRPDVGRVLKDEAGGRSGRRPRGIEENTGGRPGSSFPVVAHWRGPVSAQFEEPEQPRPGIPVERLVGFNIDPSRGGYTPERSKIYYQQLTSALGSIPGVESVGLASMRILENSEWDSSMTVA